MIEWIVENAWWLLGGGFALLIAGGGLTETRFERFALALLVPAALLFYAGFIALIWRGGNYLYRLYINSELGLGPAATIAGVALAVVMYNLRLRNRVFYGTIEIVVGTISILFATSHAGEPATVFITAVGGIYVIVRGLDNIDQGMPSDSNRRSLWERYVAFGRATVGLTEQRQRKKPKRAQH